MQNYKELGLKAGLEVHQQLDTGKLFCACPGYLRNEEPHFSITRRLHSVAGETGEVDAAVAYEASLGKEFVYQGYRDSTCLVELDEEPPHQINPHALEEALKIALLLNCDIYPISQIMRKTVIDGSNTSGFQRTVLIAHSGFVETSFGNVPIETIALEEDSARIVEKHDKNSVYRLDRLGIPLVEITTVPAMNDPNQIKEAALKIGEILRACKVKRGIGTIRQDINVSIKGHDKVEIKGFQDPSMMVKTVEIEVERQKKDKKKEGEVRNALEDGISEFLRPLPGRARMYPETDLPLLRISRDMINDLKKDLPKLKHDIRDELKKKGLSDELIGLVIEGDLDEFEVLLKVYSKDANLVGKMVSLWRAEFASKTKKSVEEIKGILNESVLEKVLENVASGKIHEGDVKRVLLKIVEGTPVHEALKVEKVDEDALEEEIRKIVAEKPGLRANAYMGMVIQKLKGKVDARKAMEILNKIVDNKKG
ncbi:Glu-tRNA(Gln) amidotransferase subunit GatE [Candidatus Pacearchaeota archaeon]|nr:Glu-tRNA(Gln) amidotransferase subunit GatE [Candidatus Pacearchaeota archaeon]